MAPKRTSQPGASANARQTARSGAGAAASARTPNRSSVAKPAASSRAKSEAAAPRKSKAPSARFVFRWWLVPVAVVGALALFVIAYYPVAKVQYQEVRQRARLQTELATIKQRNNRLSAEVARLKTPEGVEEEARDQLGMVKTGESLAVVVTGDEPTSTTVAGVPEIDSDRMSEEPVGPWTEFLDAVFGVNAQ